MKIFDTFEKVEGMSYCKKKPIVVQCKQIHEEVKPQVKDPTKLSQDLVESYLKNKLDLNKAGKKALRNGEDPDLSSMIHVEPKEKIKVDLAELK